MVAHSVIGFHHHKNSSFHLVFPFVCVWIVLTHKNKVIISNGNFVLFCPSSCDKNLLGRVEKCSVT